MSKKKDFKAFLHELGQFIIAQMNFVLENYQPYPVKGSDLQRSFDYKLVQARNEKGQFTGFGEGASVEILSNYYATFLDKGRRPNVKKVPIMILIKWIKKKGIRFNDKKTGRFLSHNTMAYMIRNSIYRNGIKGRNFIEPAFKEGEKKLELFLDNDALDIITEELDQKFK